MTPAYPFYKRLAWVLLVMGAALVYSPILIRLSSIHFYQQAQYSDLLISHLPNARFIHEAITHWNQIPLWNPTIYSGVPLAADPLSGIAYPPNWLLIAIPEPQILNLLMLTHLAWAALGAVLFARQANLPRYSAVFLALAFSGTPKIVAHYGLGHLGLILAVSWMPWLLLCTSKVIDSLEGDRRRPTLVAGGVMGVIFLADPRWSLPSLMLAGAYALFRWNLLPKGERGSLLQAGSRLLQFTTIAIGIASFLILPLYEFLKLSTRASLTSSAQNLLALEWGHLLGLLHPILAQAEQVTYLGVSVLILALIGVLTGSKAGRFWGLVLLAATLLSLGDSTPLYPTFSAIVPGASLLRVPSRMYFVSAFASAVLAGYGVRHILGSSASKLSHERILAGVVSVVAIQILINFILAGMGFIFYSQAILISGFGVLTALLFGLSPRLPTQCVIIALFGLVVLDLAHVNWRMLRPESYEGRQDQAHRFTDELSSGYGAGRVFSPSYSIPQDAAVLGQLELAYGVSPMQLKRYADYLMQATGFQDAGYSVTLPPFPSGDPTHVWDIDLDPDKLARLNITHILSDYPIQDENLIQIDSEIDTYTYQLERSRPRAWVEFGDEWRPAIISLWSPNRIRINDNGPGTLVLSEVSYPGWRVTLDGEKVEIGEVDGLFRSVDLPRGAHTVEFSFQPQSVYLGIGLFLLTVIVGILIGWKR